MTTRSDVFDELVLDAVERVEHRLGRSLSSLEVAVEDVPPSDPSAWEDSPPLGRLFPASRLGAARLVLYRRPVTSRTEGEAELAALVEAVVVEQVASLLNLPPEDLEG